MARKGLTTERVVRAAIQLIEKNGYEDFSMRELAAMLGVQTSSLYNHIKNLEELYGEIGKRAIQRLQEMLPKTNKEKTPAERLIEMANTFRFFVRDHRELYRVIMSDIQTAWKVDELFQQTLSEFQLSETQMVYWKQILSSLLHGLVWQENFSVVSESKECFDQIYELAVTCYLDGLTSALGKREMRDGK